MKDCNPQFIPGIELTDRYFDLMEDEIDEEDFEESKNLLLEEVIIENSSVTSETSIHEGYTPSTIDIPKESQKIFGADFIDTVESYTLSRIVKINNLEGVVIILSKDENFREDFIEHVIKDLEIATPNPSFFKELYKEFHKYLEKKDIKTSFARLRTNRRDLEMYNLPNLRDIKIKKICDEVYICE